MFKDFDNYIVHDITMKMHNGMVCWPGEHHEFSHEYVKSIKLRVSKPGALRGAKDVGLIIHR